MLDLYLPDISRLVAMLVKGLMIIALPHMRRNGLIIPPMRKVLARTETL
jgi:hypothetical protein